MATVARDGLDAASPHGEATPTLTQFIDRWIYVFMAALFVATALVGFVPASVFKVTAMQAGQRPWFPVEAHFHAALMGAWLALLLMQTWLMATGRRAPHMQLGALAVALVPAMIVAGFLLVVATHAQLAEAREAATSGEIARGLLAGANTAANIMLAQARIGILFAFFIGWALLVRRRDAGLHKRLMILGTAILMPPAFARILFLPNTMPESYLAQDAYTLLWISPMFLWDLYRSRRIHPAYLIWIAGFVPLSAVVHYLWGTEAWLATARAIMA